ncbi:uncharacterized protein A1O9_09074 [Exophiala aquamarina CBS 119918]|uniref:Xylanolytic transcriptional activator regulatory domain-containing protein n=1 Tax=Exophiala aquamarina CBS 119918 TaxID=1182545 RepID=A0A072P4J5_9EURO|nr:uncharacterized protein A1O9_09074 [Exophiala aquamarina CBS 119918]KEF54632.1 hypothetical protein A1O9_09074 [Exophiala aquamarina CBS 119918]
MYKLQAEEVASKPAENRFIAQKSIPMTIILSVTENSPLVPVAPRLKLLANIGAFPSRREHEAKFEVDPLQGTESVLQVQDTVSVPQPRTSGEAAGVLGRTPGTKPLSLSDEPNLELSDEEARVDTLATGTFSDEIETDIGHFGPSSNHEYFRTLSGIFAHLARDGLSTQPNTLNTWSVPRNLTASVADRRFHCSGALDYMALPDDHTAMALFNQFFTTIALTMPYFSKPTLIHEYTRLKGGRCQDFDRVHRALFNMIWAHGSSSVDSDDSEVYYRRAIGLLDSLTIRRTSQEMVQVCLLVTAFQQNNRRSVTSWTFHALSVKAAFQLGLQSQSSYQSLNSESQQLRKRLWFGVLNQDRLLSAALGRPCLIPKQHARIEPDDPKPTTIYLDAVSPDRIESWTYFRQVISISSIISDVIEVLYDHNIEATYSNIDNIVIRRLELHLDLERWRVVLPVLQNDFTAAKELASIVQAVQTFGGSFLPRYGAWFLANYSVFTASIHLFGVLLACARRPDLLSTSNISLADVRGFLNDALGTLQIVGQDSLMSQRGSSCFFKFLELFDSLLSSVRPEAVCEEQSISLCNPGLLNPQPPPEFTSGSMSSYIVQAADEFLFQHSESDYLWNNYGFPSQ